MAETLQLIFHILLRSTLQAPALYQELDIILDCVVCVGAIKSIVLTKQLTGITLLFPMREQGIQEVGCKYVNVEVIKELEYVR
jgi:hypothetical protein